MSNLPLKEYFSLLSYQSLVLVCSFLFLPRSATWLGINAQRSSADRPEHPFLTPLTSSPLRTMLCDVAATLVIVVWWGAKLRAWWYPQKVVNKVGEAEVTVRQNRGAVLLQRARDAAGASLGGSVVYFALLLLLGAPLDSLRLETYTLGLHLSLLTIWPVIWTLGLPSLYEGGIYDRFRMTKLFSDFEAGTPLERALVYPVIGTLVGAWIGAFPLPLDWDRPWQSYPLTPTVTSILGFIAGGYASWAVSAYGILREDVKRL